MLVYGNLKKLSMTVPDKVCLIHGDDRLTYRELAVKVELTARKLSGLIKKGDRVIVKVSAPIVQLCYLLGLSAAGGVCIMMDASSPEILCGKLNECYEVSLVIGEDFKLDDNPQGALPVIEPEDLFLGALSSGSTGTPKVIWRDHRSWVSAFDKQSEVFNLSSSDTLYLAGSLAYTANLNAALHLLYEGGTIVFAGSGMPRTWIHELKHYKASAIFMVPANYKALLKVVGEPVHEMKSVVSAGAKLDMDTLQGLIRCFPEACIVEYYGASELGHISYSTAEDSLKQPDTVGRAFPGVTVWIEKGAIWVESPYMAPAFRPRATVGDMGRIDESGRLYLLGREDSVINTGGVKVLPELVESALKNCPGVAEAAVCGINDTDRGQKIGAWVVKNDPQLSKKDIIRYCRKVLPRHSCPQRLFFVEELPKNLNGKIDKKRLA